MESVAERIAARLNQEMNSWKSIEFNEIEEYRNESSATDPNMWAHAIYSEHYVETALGQRFSEYLVSPDGQQETLSEYFHDGTRAADVTHSGGRGSSQKSVMIKKAYKFEASTPWTMRPYLLHYFYLAKTPLDKCLKDAEYIGIEQCLGRPAKKFLFRKFVAGTTQSDFVFSLDRETGIPLQVTFYNDPDGFSNQRPSAIWRALSFDEVEGHHLTLKSEELVYDTRPSSNPSLPRAASGKVLLRSNYQADSVHFDRDYPAAMFWPKIDEHATVIDTLSKSTVRPKPFSKTVSAAPIRAIPSMNWADQVPWIGGSLGLVLLMIALVAKFRQRG